MTADALARDVEVVAQPLRCDRCGRTVECTPADIRVFAAIGPPCCCGVAMAFPAAPFAQAVAPAQSGRRRPARSGAGVEVRRAGQARGPNLADGLVDLSADGLGVRLEVQMVPGEGVEVVLQPPGAARPIAKAGQVRWCRPAAGGYYLAGISLARPLTALEVNGLTR
jgi:hypothetical protein